MVRVRLSGESTINRAEGDDAYYADDDYDRALYSGCELAHANTCMDEDEENARKCHDS